MRACTLCQVMFPALFADNGRSQTISHVRLVAFYCRFVCVRVCMRACFSVDICVLWSVFMSVCVCVCVWMCMFAYICNCAFVCVCMSEIGCQWIRLVGIDLSPNDPASWLVLQSTVLAKHSRVYEHPTSSSDPDQLRVLIHHCRSEQLDNRPHRPRTLTSSESSSTIADPNSSITDHIDPEHWPALSPHPPLQIRTAR